MQLNHQNPYIQHTLCSSKSHGLSKKKGRRSDEKKTSADALSLKAAPAFQLLVALKPTALRLCSLMVHESDQQEEHSDACHLLKPGGAGQPHATS